MSALPFVVTGLVSGSVYALAAIGLILTYKTSGLFNFAYGALAALGATTFYELRQDAGLPWPIAAALALLIVGGGGGYLFELVARTLAVASTATRVVVSIGMLLAIQGLITLILGSSPPAYRPFLPAGSVRIGGVFVGYDQLIQIIVCVSALVGLLVFFRGRRIGKAMRAVVESSDLLGLTGTDPVVVRRTAWVIGSSFATISGMFLALGSGLDSGLLTLLVVQAFGAAAVGGFSNLGLAYIGGLGLGVATSLSQQYLPTDHLFRGLPSSLPFILLLTVLIVAPRRLPVIVSTAVASRGTASSAVKPPTSRSYVAVAVVGALFATAPLFVGFKILLVTQGLCTAMQLLSLALLVRLSGQVSLCQVGFSAVGASTFAHLATSGVPWLLALALAVLITLPVGFLVAIPAIRLSGIYLAIATFGFGILLQQLFYATPLMFGTTLSGLLAPRPGPFRSDNGYFYVVLAFTLVLCVLVLLVASSRLGRLLRAMADSPVALTTAGTNLSITKILVFCLSAGIAGLSGALSAPIVGRTGGDSFAPFSSLLLIVVLMLNGRGIVGPAFAGAIGVTAPVFITFAHPLVPYLGLLFGVGAMMVATREQLPALRQRKTRSAEHRPRRSDAPRSVAAARFTREAQRSLGPSSPSTAGAT